jgi:hypothetical protein
MQTFWGDYFLECEGLPSHLRRQAAAWSLDIFCYARVGKPPHSILIHLDPRKRIENVGLCRNEKIT